MEPRMREDISGSPSFYPARLRSRQCKDFSRGVFKVRGWIIACCDKNTILGTNPWSSVQYVQCSTCSKLKTHLVCPRVCCSVCHRVSDLTDLDKPRGDCNCHGKGTSRLSRRSRLELLLSILSNTRLCWMAMEALQISGTSGTGCKMMQTHDLYCRSWTCAVSAPAASKQAQSLSLDLAMSCRINVARVEAHQIRERCL